MALGLDRIFEAIEKEQDYTEREPLTKEQVSELFAQPLLNNDGSPVLYPNRYDEEGNPLKHSRVFLATHYHLSSGYYWRASMNLSKPHLFDSKDSTCYPLTLEAFIYLLRQEFALSDLSAHEIVKYSPTINQIIRKMRKIEELEDFNEELIHLYNNENISFNFRLLVANWLSSYPASNDFYCQNCSLEDLLLLTHPLVETRNWLNPILKNPNIVLPVMLNLCVRNELLEMILEHKDSDKILLLQSLIILRDSDLKEQQETPTHTGYWFTPSAEKPNIGWSKKSWDKAINKVVNDIKKENPALQELPVDWIEELYKA